MSFQSNHVAESSSSSSYSPQPLQFTLLEIKEATRNFDESRLLGSGGFADVYKGTIPYGEKHLDVAVKRLRPGSGEGEEAFWYEVALHSKLRHPNLLSLVGYCSDGQELIFVYDYMSRGTLYHCLHKGGVPLSWVRRLKICLETARGLEYFHSEMDTRSMALHLDFKSMNILLASNWEAKVSDFGTSKVRPTDSTYVTKNVPGTWGYRDPQFLQTGEANRKTDVFAFGVVMFELLCVKKAVCGEALSLATLAQNSIEKGILEEIIDPNLKGRISRKCLEKFAKLAYKCLHKKQEERPTMVEIVKDLESILASQEKADDKSLAKLFGGRASNQENSVGGLTLKSLDRYLYTVGGDDRILRRFNFNTLVEATENFSESNKLSSGGYKFMYKGRLQNGRDITIAHYSDVNIDMYEDCKNDALMLVESKHENVIHLLGYCINKTNAYLLYEFPFNATLADLIFDPMCNVLDWDKRCKIILEVARVLVYLHNRAPIRLIHVDVKPENILLDVNFKPKLSGFGSAMAVNETDCIYVDPIPGTLDRGYLAPEILLRLCLSTKADVFSFGVLILNIVTAQKASDGAGVARNTLVHYVQINWLEGTLSNIVDPRINNVDSTLMTNFTEIGLLCVQKDATVRPRMEEVLGMLLGTLSLTLHVSEMRTRMISGEPQYPGYDLDLDLDAPQPRHQFTLPEIELATHNFDELLVIGRGGFGSVYRGTINYEGVLLDVAIKRWSWSSSQGAEEFWTEVAMLSKLRHRHLVSLIGYCNDGQEMILVYEYMPNGSLADCLHERQAPLTWVRRLKICLEAARCFDYLHSEMDTKPRVIHLNVKSSIILLASNRAVKVSGTMFSKFVQLSTYEDTLVRGTWGYRDPHYILTGRPTPMSDVYSFGVVMFEVLCGKKAVFTSIDGEPESLATWAGGFIKNGNVHEMVDPELRGRISPECLKKFAILANRCVQYYPEERPTMGEVVMDLESILDLQERTLLH